MFLAAFFVSLVTLIKILSFLFSTNTRFIPATFSHLLYVLELLSVSLSRLSVCVSVDD